MITSEGPGWFMVLLPEGSRICCHTQEMPEVRTAAGGRKRTCPQCRSEVSWFHRGTHHVPQPTLYPAAPTGGRSELA